MKRLSVLGCAAVALGASIIASQAQTQPAPEPSPAPPPPAARTEQPQSIPPAAAPERAGLTDNQIADEVDARVAQLKANLRLTAEQDGKWGALRDALREAGVEAAKRHSAAEERLGRYDRRGQRRPDEPEATASVDQDRRSGDIAMMRLEADEMAAQASSLKKIADAAEPLYDALADRQRRILMRFIARVDRLER